MHSHFIIFILALICNLFCSSCSHYSVVTNRGVPFKTIYINAITNQAFAPNVHSLFQNQIRQTILKDNRLEISDNNSKADVQLFVTLDNYLRNINTRSSADAGRSNSVSLNLITKVSLYDNRKNVYLLKNIQLQSRESLFFDPSEALVNHREMEYQSLPKITRNLSEEITRLILSHWDDTSY